MIRSNLGIDVTVSQPTPQLTGYLTANPLSGVAPLTVTCNVIITGGSRINGSNVTYDWGDGTPTLSIPSLSAIHTYQNAGVFSITVIVNGNDGGSHKLSGVMEVS
jgi:PKD repeat protein